MENENNENADSQNGGENENSQENNENQELNLDALKQQQKELSDKNKQLFERAKKAETAEKELREKLKGLTEQQPKQLESQPTEPDYGKDAYLGYKGVTHSDDKKIVFDEAERLKLPLHEVLEMPHIKAKLETQKQAREAQDALPRGTKRAGGYTQQDVEYYLQNPDKRPEDFELAKKVLHAKRDLDKNSRKFSDIMYDE